MLALLLLAAAPSASAPPKDQVVKRGEAVTLVVADGSLRITAPGRALSSGAAGEPVRIVALPTNRTLQGIVDGPGRVRVTP